METVSSGAIAQQHARLDRLARQFKNALLGRFSIVMVVSLRPAQPQLLEHDCLQRCDSRESAPPSPKTRMLTYRLKSRSAVVAILAWLATGAA